VQIAERIRTGRRKRDVTGHLGAHRPVRPCGVEDGAAGMRSESGGEPVPARRIEVRHLAQRLGRGGAQSVRSSTIC